MIENKFWGLDQFCTKCNVTHNNLPYFQSTFSPPCHVYYANAGCSVFNQLEFNSDSGERGCF